ncbi:GPR1/FUN34/YaaH family transporter [Streptomyces sp. NPDC088194]|uniref:acetate uptake transporter family protein n=1 Tax=Streptomyces sp. NPDC088194 TaxID=3154931 RepID=UPI00344C628D
MDSTTAGPVTEGPEPPFPDGDPPPPDVRSMIRVNLRPMATPLPLGYFTVAIDSTIVSTYQAGLLPRNAEAAVALVLLPAFVLQIIVGVLAVFCRDATAATAMTSFAANWLVETLLYFVHPPQAQKVLGIFLVTFSVFVLLVMLTALSKRALAAVLVVAVPRFSVSGVADITGNVDAAHAGAALGFILAAVSMYAAWALLLEETRGRAILPIGRRGTALAIQGDLASQLKNIERQPGVRRTL